MSGLSRAFLHAGAASLVVSLWRVADVVGHHVMIRFQRALQVEGRDAADALRQAQLDTIVALRRGAVRDRAGEPIAESIFWAPFVVVGDPAAATGTFPGQASFLTARVTPGDPPAFSAGPERCSVRPLPSGARWRAGRIDRTQWETYMKPHSVPWRMLARHSEGAPFRGNPCRRKRSFPRTSCPVILPR